MSKVYSFRLDDNNPREAQARKEIKDWVDKGFSLRYVITEVLLNFGDSKNEDGEVYTLLAQIKSMVSELENTPPFDINDERNITDLPSSFMSAVKNSAKNGFRDQNK